MYPLTLLVLVYFFIPVFPEFVSDRRWYFRRIYLLSSSVSFYSFVLAIITLIRNGPSVLIVLFTILYCVFLYLAFNYWNLPCMYDVDLNCNTR